LSIFICSYNILGNGRFAMGAASGYRERWNVQSMANIFLYSPPPKRSGV